MKDHFPERPWRCRCGCGFDAIDPRLVERLNRARELAGVPFVVTSACRCPVHNAREGGKPSSAHLSGEAADIAAEEGGERFLILSGLIRAGFTRIGIGRGFIHADVSPVLPGPAVWLY